MSEKSMAYSHDADSGRAVEDIFQVSASAEVTAILTQAATLRAQTLPDFVLDSARRQAESVFLKHRRLFLGADAYEQLIDLLSAPAAPSTDVRRLLGRKLAWEL